MGAAGEALQGKSPGVGRSPDAAGSGYLRLRQASSPAPALALSVCMYFPVHCFIEEFTTLSAVLRLEGSDVDSLLYIALA